MKFNYSYKAFLITALLVGNLYLILYFTNLPKGENVVVEDEYDIEYIQEDPLDEKIASISSEKIKIETHSVNNEAEDFIKELENDRQENPETLEDKLSEMNNAISDSENNHDPYESTKKESSKTENKTSPSEEIIKHSNNKNTTNSYRLINRKATYFPNPVYTCEGFGKVVLHIEVNNLGLVTQATLNTNSSTTTNACLIENAVYYAKKARFTKDENKPLQMGSITYIFPGQE